MIKITIQVTEAELELIHCSLKNLSEKEKKEWGWEHLHKDFFRRIDKLYKLVMNGEYKPFF
tara:strand:- start:279 stop:461 length:183 start_codon:yes stop_codon:yes gene_type:complete